MKSTLNIIGLDTETGGLTPGHHSLLQVGLVAYKKGEIVDKLNLFVREDEYKVTPMAMKINKLQLHEVFDNGVRPAEVVDSIRLFVQKNFTYEEGQPILLGHNVALDRFMLQALFDSQGQNMSKYISHRSIDTMSMIWTLHDLGLLPKEACSSKGAFDYFGIEINRLHDALDDIVGTIKLYEKLLEVASGQQNHPF